MSMRLPTNPSQTPTTTGTLPMRRAIATPVAKTSGAVSSPLTISQSFITFAGLKKCNPTTSRGRFVAAPILLTSRNDVFVASTAPGFAN